MSIAQILELTDPELDALSEPEQRFVADIIVAVMELKLRLRMPQAKDPRAALQQAVKKACLTRMAREKIH